MLTVLEILRGSYCHDREDLGCKGWPSGVAEGRKEEQGHEA
jgi:hypothetical protein